VNHRAGERAPEVKCLVAAFAAVGVQDNGDISSTPDRLHLADELIASHAMLSDENVRM
jgi:hypothetical protein